MYRMSNNLLAQILTIVIYSYVLIYHIKDNEYVKMLLLTFFTMILLCSFNTSIMEPFIENGEVKDIVADTNSSAAPVEESEDSTVVGAPEVPVKPSLPSATIGSPGNMSGFDGMCLQTGNSETWMKSPSDSSLVDDNVVFSYLTGQGPLKPVFTDNSGLYGPPIDGDDSSPNKMFMFANNRSSPNCCPSTFSTSTGCVCTTQKQRDYVNRRGNNNPLNLDNTEI